MPFLLGKETLTVSLRSSSTNPLFWCLAFLTIGSAVPLYAGSGGWVDFENETSTRFPASIVGNASGQAATQTISRRSLRTAGSV